MSKVYLSGPTGHESHAVLFDEAAEFLSGDGVEVFNPARVDFCDPVFMGLPGNGFRAQMNTLTTCDAVVLLDGWRSARGCIAEVLTAVLFGCDVYELEWLADGGAQLIELDVDRDNVNDFIAHLLLNQQQFFSVDG